MCVCDKESEKEKNMTDVEYGSFVHANSKMKNFQKENANNWTFLGNPAGSAKK